jgi:hypothetical protein
MKPKLRRGILIAVSVILVLVGASAAATLPQSWGEPVDPELVVPPAPGAWARPVSELLAAEALYPSMAATNPLEPNCRIGVNGWGEQLSQVDLIGEFGTGVYFSYSSTDNPVMKAGGAEHIGMVMVYQPRPDDPPTNIDNPLSCDGLYTDYTFSLPLHDGPGGLGPVIAQNLGKLWFLGNEPDRRATDHTDVCPQQYAAAYHDFYHFVKGRDPTAQVGVAGLVQVSPGRLQYRDIVWDTYLARYGTPMPVDVWNMHIYLISETSNGDAHIAVGTDPSLRIANSFQCGVPGSICSADHDKLDLFKQQVLSMRRWMNERGQRNKPLVLSEFGINYPYNYGGICTDTVCPADPPNPYYCFCDTYGKTFHPQRVADYLRATMTYMMNAKDAGLGFPADENRLVQQWLWFSVETVAAGEASNLVRTSGGTPYLTAPGQALREYARTIPMTINLLPTAAWATSRSSADGTSPVTATLTAVIRNNGTKALNQLVHVTFYADQAQTVPIGSASFTELGGCARTSVTVQVAWPDRATGTHSFWVVVDKENAVVEDKADNVMKGVFIANPQPVYLPLTRRR